MMTSVGSGDHAMGPSPSSPVRVLLVEPDLSFKVAALEAARAAHVRVDMACVSTCGGASHALDNEQFDALLLSTNLAHYEHELANLPALMQVASERRLPVLTISPPGIRQGARGFDIPVQQSLDFEELAYGNLDRVVKAALSRVRMTGALDS
ncbi:MAG TPA: hypothetical protein VHP33_16045 [Polyangiaceae bacterium]|nr:hypothetical protein [Polyangiaceae bacterium]